MKIGLLMNRVAGGWSPADPETWGGGEEAVALWAQAMAMRGHAVTVLWDGALVEFGEHVSPQEVCADPSADRRFGGNPRWEVKYVPEGSDRGPFDVLVCRKRPDGARLGIEADRYIIWGESGLHQTMPADFATIVVPTHYTARGYQARIPALPTTVIPLGVDCFPSNGVKDPNLVLHASSPDRGLTELLRAWPDVLDQRPEARLEIAYGWDLYDACGGPPGPKAEVLMLLDKLPRVAMARRTVAELTALYQRAGVWAYYCTGGEDFCLVGGKALRAGCVPVVKPWGALHETVPALEGQGPITDPASFTAALIDAIGQHKFGSAGETQQERLQANIDTSHLRTWAEVAEKWEDMLVRTTASNVTSTLIAVPTLPPDLVPDAKVEAVTVVRAAASQWLQQTQAQHPWADPNSGVFFAPLPPKTVPDAIVIGWGMEDCDMDPAVMLKDEFVVPPDCHVMILSSLGPWRAPFRYRRIDRRTVTEIFGQQPDLHTSVTPLTDDGSALCVTTFRYDPAKMGAADLPARRARLHPQETVSVCMIAPRELDDFSLMRTLKALEPVADELVVALNGPLTGTRVSVADMLEDWRKKSGRDVTVVDALAPRYCFDCVTEHALGEETPGHRYAGFETPRNQSIAPARGDWIMWVDTDEELLHGERLRKYMRPNIFAGYALQQDHHASDPPQAFKRDTPMRMFRRVTDGSESGWRDRPDTLRRPSDAPRLTPNGWPTFHPGYTVRFSGVVHEHPGAAPSYYDGAEPVMLIPDVWLAHPGYYTEHARRGRFVRNWPLMVADRLKYPGRRLGWFLWLRDLSQHLRYSMGHYPQPTPQMVNLAEECMRIYRAEFRNTDDPYTQEASTYAQLAARMLGQGVDVTVTLEASAPHISPDPMRFQLMTIADGPEDLAAVLATKAKQLDRWTGPYA